MPILINDLPRIVEAANVPVRMNIEVSTDDPLSLPNLDLQGVGGDDCENFFTPRSPTTTPFSQWCKTARKPYDLTICVVLLRMKQLGGAAIDIR